MANPNSRLYEMERRFGSIEAILKGDLGPYLAQDVKDAMSALPRTYSDQTQQAFKDFFETYGPFYIDQVCSGGMIKAQVVLSDGATVEADHGTSATHSAVRAAAGDWAVGFDTDEDSPLSATISGQMSSQTQIIGGDHTHVIPRTSDDYERWLQSVRASPKLIRFRVRSAAELTNEPALKEAIRASIRDIYGDRADDAAMYQALIDKYHAETERVDGLEARINGTKGVSYYDCHLVRIDYREWHVVYTPCPAGESVVGTSNFVHPNVDLRMIEMMCCKAEISV